MSVNLEPMEFDCERTKVKVTIKSNKGPVRHFALVELDGKLRDEYMNIMRTRMKASPDGKTQQIVTFDGVYASLLAKSLFPCELTPDGEIDELTVSKTSLTIEELQAFRSSVQVSLFKRAQQISGLGADAEEEAKND